MAEFFAYEHIKELLGYIAFGWVVGTAAFGYGTLIVSGVKWIVKKLKKQETITEEEITNE